MDALDLFRQRYDTIHGSFVDGLFADLPEPRARQRPHGLNSVVWLVWHAMRVEDAVISRMVADRPQVLDQGRFNPRLGLTRRDVGPGMTGDDVEELSARIDVPALRAYVQAVAEQTSAVAATLPAPAWAEVVDPERVRRVVADEGLLLQAGSWVGEFWASGHPRAFYLLQVGLLHPYGHWFDAQTTRGLLLAPGG